jgi:hypothetical protein
MKTLFTGSKSAGSDGRRTRWGVLGSSLAAVALLAAPLVIDIGTHGASGLIGSAEAAPGGIPGPPDGGGGAAPDFGDLIILYRDDNGVPYPSPEVQVEDPDGVLVDGGLCWQPIAFNVSDDPDTVCPTSCVVDSVPTGTDVVDVNQYSCAVADGCSGCTQETEFGRINEARAPDAVFESQLEDVVVSLSIADCTTLDPAGRLVANVVDDITLDNLAKTIDSPLQNLAIYRELMLTGFIGTAPGIPLPDDNFYNTAARGLGAASDKSGGVNVDLVAYLNQIMGLSDPATPTVLGKLCETYREEVQGVIQLVEKCYLNYGAEQSDIEPAGANYAYTRADNFLALPDPAYIPEGDAAMDGWFEYLAVVDPAAEVPSFQIDQGLIQDAVFCVDGDGNPLDPVFNTPCAGTVAEFTGDNIGAFAQASDDARAVISFMHENQVPVGYETPVPCEASDENFYDLSLSEESGLQVPTKYVNNKEREFFVNVTNLGPDTANGVVTVVATNGGTLGEWSFPFVDLPAGQTVSNTQLFIINTTSDTINWTATVVAGPPGTDPNPGNNEVTAISTVNNPGGGGSGGQGGNPNN